MKRSFFLAASFILVAGASTVNAQLANYTVTAPNLTENATDANNKSASVAGVNTAVTESFSKNFPGVSNVTMSKADKTTWGYFKQDDIPVRVSYNEKGKLLYTIRYYNGSQVLPSVQNALTREGFTLPITHVTEIKTRYSTFNLVKMEDKNSIITVRVSPNAEVSVVEELNKG